MATNQRIGISSNLPNGGTYDLLILDHPDGYPEGKIDFKISDTPRKITGIQKVAQLFLKILFTRKGSDVLNPAFGTLFSDYTVNANRTGVDRDLYIALSNEVREAEIQSISILNTVDSDVASQIDKISILGIDTSKDSITLYVRILTQAGIGAQVAVPFPELDMQLSEG